MKKVLVVTYGAGHAAMLLPVAKALQDQNLAHVVVLGLTTAAAAVRSMGLPLLQFKDFWDGAPAHAAQWGQMHANALGLHASVDQEESVAYLGMSFADLVAMRGIVEAFKIYEKDGRQGFFPLLTLQRILRTVQPDVVLISNSPRAEKAAGYAARALGIPCVCVNALFAIDEIHWLKLPEFADIVCVLNDAVAQFLYAQGRPLSHIRVTGNPAFDALKNADLLAQAQQYRQRCAQLTQRTPKRFVLWASQPEPASHPTAPQKTGDPSFPAAILAVLVRWAAQRTDVVLIVRPHPSEPTPVVAACGVVVCPSSILPIATLLHACDMVVTMTSTVGVEASVLGLSVVQVQGSIFDHALPLSAMNMAQSASLATLETILDAHVDQSADKLPPSKSKGAKIGHATQSVVSVVKEFL